MSKPKTNTWRGEADPSFISFRDFRSRLDQDGDFPLRSGGMDIAALGAADFRRWGGLAVTMRVSLGMPKDPDVAGALASPMSIRSGAVTLPNTRLPHQRKGDG